jgi:hypothetical protein
MDRKFNDTALQAIIESNIREVKVMSPDYADFESPGVNLIKLSFFVNDAEAK